jgi:hypothetical protein
VEPLVRCVRRAHPELADELVRRARNELPENWAAEADAYIRKLQADGPVVARARPRRWRWKPTARCCPN